MAERGKRIGEIWLRKCGRRRRCGGAGSRGAAGVHEREEPAEDGEGREKLEDEPAIFAPDPRHVEAWAETGASDGATSNGNTRASHSA